MSIIDDQGTNPIIAAGVGSWSNVCLVPTLGFSNGTTGPDDSEAGRVIKGEVYTAGATHGEVG